MSEGPPLQPVEQAGEETHEERTPLARYIELAKELAESHERFPFPGIDSQAYAQIKADEAEYPGYTTPIDELIERFTNEGIRVDMGPFPESGNVLILPAQSTDINNDSIIPRQLHTGGVVGAGLRELIEIGRQRVLVV